MTTEVVKEEDLQSETTEQTQKEREYSEIELKAIDQGWIPKEEFDGDESEFIDAPEFVRRGELFEKIERQSKELKNVRHALEAFKQHHSKVKEAEFERALKALREERKNAVIDGEHERALALEEKIDEIRAEKDQIKEDPLYAPIEDEPEGYSPQMQSWVNRNQWYETNETMRATADALGKKFYEQGHSPHEVLALVEREIKKEFAHKFKGAARGTTQAVSSSTRSGKSSADKFQLSPEETKIMRKFVDSGVMTEEQYIKDLKAIRGES